MLDPRLVVSFALVALLPAQEAHLPAPAEVVARAVVLEQVEGDAAAAEALLRERADAAAQAGDTVGRAELVRARVDLLLRQGKPAAAVAALSRLEPGTQAAQPVAPPAPHDPVRVLVQQLDLGTTADKRVAQAANQLRALGELAAPPLLESLRSGGPFGRTNALTLLMSTFTPAVRDALLARVRAGDATVARTLANSVGGLGGDVTLVVHTLIDHAGDDVLVAALASLTRGDVGAGTAETLARRLAQAEDADVRRRVAEVLPLASWARAVADRLRQDADARVARAGALAFLGQLGDDEEGLALEVVRALPPEALGAVTRPAWVRVAALVLPAMQLGERAHLVSSVNWSRDPDLAVQVLLTTPNVGWGDVRSRLEALAQRGFTLPERLDALFVAALRERPADDVGELWGKLLPADGEARALRHLDALPPAALRSLARSVVLRDLPWLGFAVHAVGKQPGIVDLERFDWSDAAPPVVDAMTDLALRGTRHDRNALLDALQSSRRPPLPPVLAYLADDANAGRAVRIAQRVDPVRTLEALSGLATIPDMQGHDLLPLLPVCTPAQLPTLLRLAAASEFLADVDGGDDAMVNALVKIGAGDPRILALARLPSAVDDREWLARQRAAQACAQRLTSEGVPEALALLPALSRDVAAALLARLPRVVAPAHAAGVRAALDAAFQARPTRWPGDRSTLDALALVEGLTAALQRLGEGAAPHLQDALARAPQWAEMHVARALLAVSGARASDLLRQLLASDRRSLVQVALAAEQTAADEDLRALALAAVERLPGRSESGAGTALDPAAFLTRLPRGVRADTGKHLLDTLDLDRAAPEVVIAIVQALGGLQDASVVPWLILPHRHPSANVREQVAIQLGRLVDRAAVPTLLALLKDDSGDVVRAAETALERLTRYEEIASKLEVRK